MSNNQEYLSTDQQFLVTSYRRLVAILEQVELGESSIDEFKSAVYTYIFQLLPKRFVYNIQLTTDEFVAELKRNLLPLNGFDKNTVFTIIDTLQTKRRTFPTFEELELRFAEKDMDQLRVIDLAVNDIFDNRKAKSSLTLNRQVKVGDYLCNRIRDILEDPIPRGLGIMNIFESDKSEPTGRPTL